jgi:alpha-beta hydrolase superfamily lysophospholipase
MWLAVLLGVNVQVSDAVVVHHGWPSVVTDFEYVVSGLAEKVDDAVVAHPGLPVVLIGHAVGGMVAVRYAQRYPDRVGALVLAAPVLGPWQALDLLYEQEIDDSPLPHETLRAVESCLSTIDFDHPLGDDMPALWLHGDDDTFVPVADTRAGLDRVRGLRFSERIYPGVGHDVLWSATASADIAAFLRSCVPDRSPG